MITRAFNKSIRERGEIIFGEFYPRKYSLKYKKAIPNHLKGIFTMMLPKEELVKINNSSLKSLKGNNMTKSQKEKRRIRKVQSK